MKRNKFYFAIGGLLAAVLGAGVVSAQPQARRDRGGEGDGVGVARIATVSGDVAKRHGDTGDLVSADAGAPLVSGDSVLTKGAARVEIRLDNSNFLRLAANSEVKLRQLGDHYFQVDVVRGEVGYTMLKYGRAEASLHTATTDFVLAKEGVYRVRIESPQASRIDVRKGEAEALTPQKSVMVYRGHSLRVEEQDHGIRTAAANLAPKDGFDQWVERRDHLLSEGRGGYGGWYPRTVVGVGYGYPFYDPFWGFYGGYYGGYYGGGYHHRPVMRGRWR